MHTGKSDFWSCLDIVVGILITVRLIGNFKEISAISNGLHVILCTQLHDKFFMHLAASARCMVLFSAKGVHVSWCHPGSLMHLLTHSLVHAPCSGKGSHGASPFPLTFCKDSHSVHTCCRLFVPFQFPGVDYGS